MGGFSNCISVPLRKLRLRQKKWFSYKKNVYFEIYKLNAKTNAFFKKKFVLVFHFRTGSACFV